MLQYRKIWSRIASHTSTAPQLARFSWHDPCSRYVDNEFHNSTFVSSILRLFWMALVTPDELFRRGLLLGGFNGACIDNVSRSTSLARFRSLYGSNPIVYAEIWQDLQTTDILDARITTGGVFVNLDSFLLAIYFLNCYPTEPQLAATFKVCEKTARKCCWFFAKKVQALKAAKVSSLLHSSSLNVVVRLTIMLSCC